MLYSICQKIDGHEIKIGMLQKQPCVYILTNKPHGVLYVGVTMNLAQRIWQHKKGEGSVFTRKYNLHRLVWYELHETMEEAIHREKCIKEWKRNWKIELIETMNPDWIDLYETLQ